MPNIYCTMRLALLCRVAVPRRHWFFKKCWCIFWWVFLCPRTTYLFFTGADLRPSSPIPGHEGLRPPSWGCVVIRRGRYWFVSNIGCACAKLLFVTHRASSGWDKTRDTARGFLTGTYRAVVQNFLLCFLRCLLRTKGWADNIGIWIFNRRDCLRNDYRLRKFGVAKSPVCGCF